MTKSHTCQFPRRTLGNLYISSTTFPHGRSWIGQAAGEVAVNVGEDQLLGIALGYDCGPGELKGNTPAFSQFNSVDLSMTDYSGAVLVACAEVMVNTRELRLDFARLGPGDLKCLKNLKDLQTIWLTGSTLSNEHLADLAALESLRNLTIKNTKVDAQGLKYLAGHAALTRLHLPMGMQDEAISALVPLPSLSELDISYSKISAKAAQHLSQLQSLDTLFINDTECGDELIAGLKDAKKLQSLFLNGAKITDKCADSLLEMTNLRHLELRDTGLSEVAAQRIRTRLSECDVFF